MTIIRTNIKNLEQDRKTLYMLTKSKGLSVKDVDGVFAVRAFLIYEDENAKGEIQTVTAILCDGETKPVKLQSISATFRREFEDIVDIMGDEEFSIAIVHGKSKSGRDFVSCEMFCD